MIVPEKGMTQVEDSKLMAQQESVTDTNRVPEDDLPPAYNDEVHGIPPEASSSSAAANPWQGIKPINMLSIVERGKPIRGNYVLDPRLHIPLNLLPEQTEAGRKNLNFETRDGTIDVGVWLVGREVGGDVKGRMERTTIGARSRDAAVTMRVDTTPRHDPFLLDVYSRDGRVTVHLPRSFHGAIYLKTKDGKRELSEGLRANSTDLGAAERTMRYFIGALPTVEHEQWEGDELRVETRDSRIKVQYIDEIEAHSSKGSFLSRVFSS